MSTTMGSFERTGDDTESSLKILARKINEIIDVLSDCEPKTPAKWVPEYDEEYFFIDDRGRLGWDDWNNSGSDAEIYRLKTNNVFKTETEAIEARDKIMNTNEGVV